MLLDIITDYSVSYIIRKYSSNEDINTYLIKQISDRIFSYKSLDDVNR